MSSRSALSALIIASSLLLSPAASAQDPLTRAATGVGKIIAAQGNAALLEIRQEFQKDLLERLRPTVPQPETPAPELPARSDC